MKTGTNAQIEILRNRFASLSTVDPDLFLPRIHEIFDRCDDKMIQMLIDAKIKFVSSIAINEKRRRTTAKNDLMNN